MNIYTKTFLFLMISKRKFSFWWLFASVTNRIRNLHVISKYICSKVILYINIQNHKFSLFSNSSSFPHSRTKTFFPPKPPSVTYLCLYLHLSLSSPTTRHKSDMERNQDKVLTPLKTLSPLLLTEQLVLRFFFPRHTISL